MKKKVFLVIMLMMGIQVLAGCSQAVSGMGVETDLNSMSLDELISKAQEEGEVNSVGMPDSWANWGETWNDIETTYGLTHTDVDMSSAEELAMFQAEKDNATKDIGDVGQSFGPVAIESDLALSSKTSYWDGIPEWAKDEDGYTIIAYYGTMAILVNENLIDSVPESFEDLLNGDYTITVGDVAKANQAQNAVLAASIAFGGSESDLDPGLNFFQEIAKQGRLDLGELSISRIEKGEIAVALLWDYNALSYRDNIVDANPDANITVCIPQDGSIQSGYTTIINKYSKRPHAAALAREYILSDEGQINLAKGYAKPVRDVELPAEVKEKLLDDSQYVNARLINDQDSWDESSATLAERWQVEVLAY